MNYLFVKYVQLTSLQGCNKKWSFHLPQLFFFPPEVVLQVVVYLVSIPCYIYHIAYTVTVG